MTPRDFCYWLQGFFELNNPESLNEEQTLLVKKYLYNVFQHNCEHITQQDLDKGVFPRYYEAVTVDPNRGWWTNNEVRCFLNVCPPNDLNQNHNCNIFNGSY